MALLNITQNIIKTFKISILVFWGVTPSSRLKMKAVCLSEMLISTYEFTRCHNPEEQHRHFHRRENLRYHLFSFDKYENIFLHQPFLSKQLRHSVKSKFSHHYKIRIRFVTLYSTE
jgi:hypothetical protein